MKVTLTKDGSNTLQLPDQDVFYHSVNGAWNETQHVFGERGLEAAFQRAPSGPIKVLEIGMGTGLNVLDAWIRAHQHSRTVEVHSLEPFPLNWKDVEPLGYNQLTGVPREVWQSLHERGGWSDEWFHAIRIEAGLFEASLQEQEYDVVLFDAFAPATQPELWTVEAMDKMRCTLKPGGQLVTYCAKGDVRRAMQKAGFSVERMPGPPGKREMLRATRLDVPAGRFNVRVYMIVTRMCPSTGQEQALLSFERLAMGGVMKFPGGGLEWGEGTTACLRREALEELGQPIEVGPLVHVSQGAYPSSFDAKEQILAVHYAAELKGDVAFDDSGTIDDVFGKQVEMGHQRLGWKDILSIQLSDFSFASDREAWEAWLSTNKTVNSANPNAAPRTH